MCHYNCWNRFLGAFEKGGNYNHILEWNDSHYITWMLTDILPTIHKKLTYVKQVFAKNFKEQITAVSIVIYTTQKKLSYTFLSLWYAKSFGPIE